MPTKPLNLPASIDLAQFVSVQAHDLRSPFNQSVGFSKIMLNGQDGALTDLQREDLTTIYRSSLRALTLMNGLIDIARLGRSEKSACPATFAWATILEQAATQWKKFNGGRRVEIDTTVEDQKPVFTADEVQLKQIIGGLMTLVAEFIADPGRIAVRVDYEPEWCVVTVSSEGPKAQLPSTLDCDLFGFVSSELIKLNRGQIRPALETEAGAIVCFALPNVDAAADEGSAGIAAC